MKIPSHPKDGRSKTALFLITELEKPVGGLSRFASEFLECWRESFAQGKTEFEPLVLAMHDPALALVDLQPSKKFAELTAKYPQITIYEATSPAISTNCMVVGRTAWGLVMAAMTSSRGSGSRTTPTLGSMVQKG